MSEWKEIRLGDLCYRVCSGGTPKSTCSTYYEGGKIPWLNTKEINYNRLYTTESHITEEGLNNSSAKWIDANSVIVAMYGATAGRVAIAKVPMTTNQACCNLMIDSSKADYNFIYYYLSMSYKQLLNMANGAAQQNLNAQVIKDFVVSLPDIQEQRHIASILSSLDDKIAVNKKICENLEAQAQALFKHWFVDYTPFFAEQSGKAERKDGNFCANREQNETCFNSAEVQPKITGKACKFVESELGMIPEGWRVGTLGDIAEFKRGKTITKSDVKEGLIPVVAGGLEPAYYHNQSNTSSRVITISGSGANAGFTRMYYQPVWASDCSFVDNAATQFLHTAYCYLLTNKKNVDALQWGAAQPHVYAKDINKLPLAIAPLDVLNQFEGMVSGMFDLIDVNDKEIIRLTTLRDTLLPKLMSGQIKVNEIEKSL